MKAIYYLHFLVKLLNAAHVTIKYNFICMNSDMQKDQFQLLC